ncbi:efflux RND transporter periplasmic adaptor subunit [Acidipila sp. EB88]|uniref:efflux RND transporter periplasmic adaptor subunit n=1 Tax=Acidipila sp. EB88 TaxID=2305226 RepID=UPI000F5E7D16|nr:efflux RND transporter periplasmic adaptor subunit [Acidipila sp. EB88]RRA49470.1 efflux RND transporter periplasmic adaptor subunit [Acidipila sp. EB88]
MANDRPTSGTRNIIIWTAAVLVVALVSYMAHVATRTVLQVRAFTVVRGPIRSSVSTNGKVQPVNNYEAHAPYPGLVKSLLVHEGDVVPAGKLLLTMDSVDAQTRLAQARATLAGALANQRSVESGGVPEDRYTFNGQVEQAQADERAAQQSLTTLQQLAAKGAASPSEVLQAQNRLASDHANLQVLQQRQTARKTPPNAEQARAEVVEAQAAVNGALDALNKSSVRAPFAGTVYSVPASQTEYVQQGDKLLQEADLTHMEVLAYFDEPDIGKLSIGQPVRVTWTGKPDEVWHGHIKRLPATVVTYTTRNVGELICSLDDPHDGLLPDTNVDVTVTTREVQDALYVPREALHTEQGLTYVYKVVHGALKRAAVQVGNLNLTQVQIVTGVAAGDVVALNTLGGQPLVDKVAVAVQQQ